MPLCGFNQEMLEGMNKFHEGLVEAIVVDDIINKESLDLDLEIKK